MYLHPSARRFYIIDIGADPAVTTTEASFAPDDPFVAGEPVDGGGFRWLIAGPDYVAADELPYQTVRETYAPRIGFPGNPERDVEPGPLVILTPS